jgi:putative membrane protein
MENIVLAKKLNKIAVVVSVLVVGLVVYSFTSALAAVFLLLGLYFIRQKKVAQHKKMVTTALILSFLFLLMYVVYHITTPEIKYCGEGTIRTVYFLLLITHVVLAAVSFPFILFTYIRGFTMQVEKHKAMSRWVYWVWLYVSITGPVVYLMLRPCLNS